MLIFLDITLNIEDMSYKPYKKPNDTPLYIDRQSNHPQNIIRNIPDMVSKRLSKLSNDEQSFNSMKHHYESALRHSGYTEPLPYQILDMHSRKRVRKRNIIWYNPESALQL